MRVGSDLLDLKFKPVREEITWRRTTNYAAATGDNNPAYLDDRQPQGLIAPPMLATALTWPIWAAVKDNLEAGSFPGPVFNRQVHYTEDLILLRPIRPGDRLRIETRFEALMPHRAGTYLVLRYDAFDRREEPVFTERFGVVLRGVECADAGQGAERLTRPPAGPARAEPLWESWNEIGPLLPYVYDGCSGIVFAIHTSPAFAQEVGLPGVILQGTASLALAARDLVNREAEADPARLKRLAGRFTAMVRPGQEIRVQLLGRQADDRGRDLFFSVLNAQGQKAISDGYARLEET